MIEVPHLQENNETMRTFCRRNRTVPGKGPKTVFIGQNLTRFVTFSRQLSQNVSFSFRMMWIMEEFLRIYEL